MPVIPSTEYENHAVVMVPPPLSIVPFMVIVAKARIFFAIPVLAPLDMTRSLKLRTLDSRTARAWQIEMSRIKLARWSPNRRTSGLAGGNYCAFWCLYSARFLPFAVLLRTTKSLTLSIHFVLLFFCESWSSRLSSSSSSWTISLRLWVAGLCDLRCVPSFWSSRWRWLYSR
jgi:hypothetical protein